MDKVRAAVLKRYRTVPIPAGQPYEPHWNLTGLSVELNVTIQKVHTIKEAHELIPDRKL